MQKIYKTRIAILLIMSFIGSIAFSQKYTIQDSCQFHEENLLILQPAFSSNEITFNISNPFNNNKNLIFSCYPDNNLKIKTIKSFNRLDERIIAQWNQRIVYSYYDTNRIKRIMFSQINSDTINKDEEQINLNHDVNGAFFIDSNNIIFYSDYNYSDTGLIDKINLYLYNFAKRKIEKKLSIDIGYDILLSVYSKQWLTAYDGHICIAHPSKKIIYRYDFQFNIKDTISINNNVNNKIRKYLNSTISSFYRNNPKKMMSDFDKNGISYYERIQKIFYVAQDIICITLIEEFCKDSCKRILYYNTKTKHFISDKIVRNYPSFISNSGNVNLSRDSILIGIIIKQNPQHNFTSSLVLYNFNSEDLNEDTLDRNLLEHQIKLDTIKKANSQNNILQVSKRKLISLKLQSSDLKPINLIDSSFKYVMFIDSYICSNCYFKDIEKTIFICKSKKDNAIEYTYFKNKLKTKNIFFNQIDIEMLNNVQLDLVQ